MARFTAPLLLVLLPLAAFLAFFPAATLDVGNPGWLIRGTDNGENALGLHAYLHDPAAGATLRTRLLNAPEGVPVLFTDSNPLLALSAKALAEWLPPDAQVVGPFILLSLVLQAVFAWLLLRRHAPGAAALWLGVLLLAFPPTLFNRFIHANLMSHWTILAALWLFLDPRRGRGLRWWGPLIAITALIHSYLLVMVGAIWASAMLARFVAGSFRARGRVLLEGAAVLVLVAALAWWMGVGGQAAAANYGRFSMPLDALWNAQIDSFSTLLPAHEASPGRGFEGFHYLGAGGLLLVLTALAVATRYAPRPRELRVKRRLRALVPALIVLTILAIARLPLPEAALAALDPVRASGRLFWPVGYVLMLIALLAAYRLPAERAGQLLLVVLAVQVVDLSNMARAIRAQSADASAHRLYARTPDPRWDALVGNARSVAFVRGDITDHLDVYQEVAWRAVKSQRPVTSVYAARTSPETRARLAREEAAFARGALVPGRLYVVLPGGAPPPWPTMTLDGIRTIAVPVRPAAP